MRSMRDASDAIAMNGRRRDIPTNSPKAAPTWRSSSPANCRRSRGPSSARSLSREVKSGSLALTLGPGVDAESLQPALEVDELPQEHHVIFARLARGDDLLVFSYEPIHFQRVIDAALPKRARRDEIAQRGGVPAAEPYMRRRVPAGFLHSRARFLGQDTLHGPPQQDLGDAIADLERAG